MQHFFSSNELKSKQKKVFLFHKINHLGFGGGSLLIYIIRFIYNGSFGSL